MVKTPIMYTITNVPRRLRKGHAIESPYAQYVGFQRMFNRAALKRKFISHCLTNTPPLPADIYKEMRQTIQNYYSAIVLKCHHEDTNFLFKALHDLRKVYAELKYIVLHAPFAQLTL